MRAINLRGLALGSSGSDNENGADLAVIDTQPRVEHCRAQEYEPAGKSTADIQNVCMSICRSVDMSTKKGSTHGKSRLAARNA